MDRASGGGRELLADDRAHQRAVMVARTTRAAVSEPVDADLVDQGCQHRIGRSEVSHRRLHGGGSL
jgi:hypothetical protein